MASLISFFEQDLFMYLYNILRKSLGKESAVLINNDKIGSRMKMYIERNI